MDPARQGEALAHKLPPLLVAAERVAASVAAGVHGRRRTGTGDAFWQYRAFMPGDAPNRIDWRQTGKSDRAYVRETEWEAAQTVYLWRDASPSMDWASRRDLPRKRERAELLLLALASLLLRGGERVGLPGQPVAGLGRHALQQLATHLPFATSTPVNDLPRYAQLVLFGDFLQPPDQIRSMLIGFANRAARVQLVQILDPAEMDLPFRGRVRFEGLAGESDLLIPRSEAIRDDYARALAAHQSALAEIAAALRAGCMTHCTATRPETALLALHTALTQSA